MDHYGGLLEQMCDSTYLSIIAEISSVSGHDCQEHVHD